MDVFIHEECSINKSCTPIEGTVCWDSGMSYKTQLVTSVARRKKKKELKNHITLKINDFPNQLCLNDRF